MQNLLGSGFTTINTILTDDGGSCPLDRILHNSNSFEEIMLVVNLIYCHELKMFFLFNFLLFQENQTETLENGTVIEYVDNVTVVNPCYLLRTDTTDDKVRISNRNVTQQV